MGWQDAPIAAPAAQGWAAAPLATPAPSKYDQAAASELAAIKAANEKSGLPSWAQSNPAYGPTESFINGAMLGALPTVMAGLTTPVEMIARGTADPREAYNYAKAKQNAMMAAAKAEHPYLNTAADLAGSMMGGAGLAHAGVTAVREGAGLLGRIAGSAVDGAGLGAASGFLSGEGEGRLTGAGEGALIGGGIGAVVPAMGSVLKGVAAPVVNNVAARIWPEDAAKSTLARAIQSSGKSLPELQGALKDASAAGQGQFTLADALGKPGGDVLSNVVRSPGEGGTMAADFLDARQAAQGRDVANQLSQGLGVNRTAKQLADALTTERGAQADINYGLARSTPGAAAVDVSPAIAAADSVLTPGVTKLVNPNSNIADNSVEAAVRRAKSYLTDGRSQLSNFNDVLSAKQEIDNLIEGATPTIQRALMPIKKALDNAMIDASPMYQLARDTFAKQSRAIEAIDTGKAAARSGRTEDTIPAYNALHPEAQAAYRTGYVDPLIENAINGNPMANKALPLANEGARAELAAMAGPKAQALAQALDRSMTMNATYRRARTGSQTFDNLAEGHQQGIDPGVLLEVAHGNWKGLVLDMLRHAGNSYSGTTPEVRRRLAELLLTRGGNADVEKALAPNLLNIQRRDAILKALRGASAGGGAIAAGQSISGPRR